MHGSRAFSGFSEIGASGNGVALIPSSLKAIKRKGVVYKTLAEGAMMSIGIGVAFRPGDDSVLVQDFVQSVRDHYASRLPSR